MMTSRLTSKGQTTVPREIRQRLGLKPGDALLYVEEAGRVVLLKQPAEVPTDDPFASFTEWNSVADRRGYGGL